MQSLLDTLFSLQTKLSILNLFSLLGLRVLLLGPSYGGRCSNRTRNYAVSRLMYIKHAAATHKADRGHK